MTTPYMVLALVTGAFRIDLPEQWDPKSPWHDRRVLQFEDLKLGK